MKLVLVALAVFAVSFGSALPRYHPSTFGLKEDLDDLIAILPVQQIQNIVFDYMASDAEIQELLEYLVSEDFKQLLLDIEAIPEYKEFLKYLEHSGLNVYYYLGKLHDLVGLPPFVPKALSPRRGTGLRGMLDDIEAILPIQKIKDWYYNKLETSPAFKNLIERMRADEFKGIIEKLKANKSYQELVKLAKEHGVDIELIRDILRKIFGWDKSRRAATFSLSDDLNDFLALLPIDEMVNIMTDYLANDPEVQAVMEYMQSEEFRQLIVKIDNVQEFLDFLNYIQKNGIDIYKLINQVHEILGLPPLNPPVRRTIARRGVGMRGLIDDLEALLPIEKIKALYHEKLNSSPDFAALIKMMQGDEFKSMINRLAANPTVKDIVARLKGYGIDVARAIEFLNKVFGWGLQPSFVRRSSRNLKDDLNDFLALVPKEEILAIAVDYLANDPEVQEAVEFVQSDDFKKLVLEIESVPVYIKFLNYLESSGLQVYEMINKLHDLLGLPHLNPSFHRRVTRRGTGIRGMIDDIKAILPIDKIKALYHEKLETSKDFAALVQMLKGDEFKNMIKEMQQNPTIQKIIATAKQHGVDVKLIVDLLNKIFGWGLEESFYRGMNRSLRDDLDDFLALIPKEEIVEVLIDYMMNDPEVQDAVAFVQSEDFKKLVLEIESVLAYIKFLNYLESQGLHVYALINQLHDLLGLPHLTPPMFHKLGRRGTGFRGLIDDIEALLPIEKIKALYYEKLQSSEDFANLIKMMKSEEFGNLIKDMQKNPTIQEVIGYAKQHGIDIPLLVNLLNKIFGWGLEESFRVVFY